MKIAGYIIHNEVLEWGAFEPKTVRSIVHRQCAWNADMLYPEDEMDLQKIPMEQAALYACSGCGKLLSEPAWFAFQAERIS